MTSPALTAAIPVLCFYRAYTLDRRRGKDWFEGTKVIHVVRSRDILPEFEFAMTELSREWRPMSLQPRIDGWELVSYRPYNGRPHF